MIKRLDVDDLERQVNAAIVSPPGVIVEEVLRGARKRLPLEEFDDIIDREIADREERFPEDKIAIQRLQRLQERVHAALSKP